MSNTKHTAEPWSVNGKLGDFSGMQINDADGAFVIAEMHGKQHKRDSYAPAPKTAEANAARIVACVNACAGKDPEVMRQKAAAFDRIFAELYMDQGEVCRLKEWDGGTIERVAEIVTEVRNPSDEA